MSANLVQRACHGCMFSSCACPLQLLARSLDVFIVSLVLLLVHLRQRPQAFDAMLCLHQTLSVFKGRRTSAGLMIPL
jgi:hypothetical protein